MMPRLGNTNKTDVSTTKQHRSAAHPEVVLPPAPPGESAPEAVEKTKAVAEALMQLGEEAEPRAVVEYISKTGLKIELKEVLTIRAELLKRASTPPGPDQPPPAP